MSIECPLYVHRMFIVCSSDPHWIFLTALDAEYSGSKLDCLRSSGKNTRLYSLYYNKNYFCPQFRRLISMPPCIKFKAPHYTHYII
uniref:PlrA n=1 Tax=Saccharolobus solfataricus TaxID=2287 RepID=Q6PN96_SACSO|nr:PlrA [Saccharolobus solfataricus]